MLNKLQLRNHSLLCVLLVAVLSSTIQLSAQTTYYVDINHGSDSNDGQAGRPFKTIEHAQAVLRSVSPSMQSDITVYIEPGLYRASSQLIFTPEDSGKNGHYINWFADPNQTAEAQISAGYRIQGWTQVSGKPYYSADLSGTPLQGVYFRQIYVGGVRATQTLTRISNPASIYFETVNGKPFYEGIVENASDVAPFTSYVSNLRLVHYYAFKADYFPVTSITNTGSTDIIRLQQPYANIRGSRADYFSADNGQWYLQNALSALTSPGHFYLDEANSKVYYYPRSGENLDTDDVEAPRWETALMLKGTSSTSKVENLHFKGLAFEYGNWSLPGTQFIGGSQAEALLGRLNELADNPNLPQNQYYDSVPGEVYLYLTSNIVFTNNIIRHSASGGIEVHNGAENTIIEGNITYDTSAAGIIVGQLQGLYLGSAGTTPWELAPFDPKIEQSSNTTITNNIVYDTGADYLQATGISLMNPLFTTVSNNLVYHTAYMGIHSRANDAGGVPDSSKVGNNSMTHNVVTDDNYPGILFDDGAIYSYGLNPSVNIANNFVYHAQTAFSVYIDNQSRDAVVSANVVTRDINLDCANGATGTQVQYNYIATNAPTDAGGINSSPGSFPNCSTQTSNHPFTTAVPWDADAENIINNAGLSANYQYLLNKMAVKPSPYPTTSTNQ